MGHPIARGAGGGIPGNDLGQGSTSPSTFTHVLGVSGAPIGAVGGAAADRRNMGNAHGGPKRRVPHVSTAVGGTADTAPIGAPETPRTWAKRLGLVEPWPR